MLKIYNTLTRSKDEFIPIEPGKVRMYSCGPTVYNYMHIGNLRSFFFEDILLRVLKYNGYEVKYVMNITDVGHLVSDSDEGEDKMELSAKSLGKTVWEVTKYYSDVFKKDILRLNIIPPDIYSLATDYIPEQIELIKCLEKKDFTYITSDGVYYDTSKFPDYGKLARLNIKGLQEGSRIEFSAEKKNITDFALWKFSPKDEKRLLEWESPWGLGFPGWHIECSAMTKALLGNHFDIHCGGIDHIPIHHTNEIAQSEACNGEKYVNYWLHGEFLDMGSEKMSKSTGNFVTLQTLIDKGYSPLDYRYFLLMAHYKKKIKFTFEALDAARSGYKNLKGKILWLKSKTEDERRETGDGKREMKDESRRMITDYKKKFLDKINDDLNMPEAMSVLWDMIKDDGLNAEDKLELAYNFDKIFGLNFNNIEKEKNEIEIPEDVLMLIEKRKDAKKNRDFKSADEIRNEIREKGFDILDTKSGVEIKKL
ncbi:MAG TPA: cysteine--tRNA ligase [Ignavibacteria bacterium]|nr:cysteine--tRNA ligase [Ignavibacteria bacterium]